MFSVSISSRDFQTIQSRLFTEDGLENAAFATCGSSIQGKRINLYVRELLPVPEDAYRSRTAYHMEVSPSFINHVIDATEQRFSILIIHSHPGNLTPEYSSSDNEGEARLFRVFQDLLPNLPHASLLFSSKGVRGRFWNGKRFQNSDEVRVVGSSFRKISLAAPKGKIDAQSNGIYDRQVLAFGDELQSQLETMKIGIVGLGGSGSSVAEQLVRLGIRDFVLVDNDHFEPSNITRTYGSKHSDLFKSQHKTKIAARNLRSIRPVVQIEEIRDSVTYQRTLMKLKDRDVLFCCTDNDLSRSMVNRFSYQYFIPVIDMGVRIVAEESKVLAAAGRVSLIGPGLPCLRSSHHLDSERIRVESLDPREREKLAKEGYVQGIEVRAPAVISLNSTVSSLAVTMFLSLLSGFSTVPGVASEEIYDAVEGIMFKSKPKSDPVCGVCGLHGLGAFGDLQVVSTYGGDEATPQRIRITPGDR